MLFFDTRIFLPGLDTHCVVLSRHAVEMTPAAAAAARMPFPQAQYHGCLPGSVHFILWTLGSGGERGDIPYVGVTC